MQKLTLRVVLMLMTTGFFFTSFSQTKTNTEVLKQGAVVQAEKEKVLYEQLQTLARQKGWEMVLKRPNGGIAILVGVNELGYPIYTGTDNNSDAAATIGTNTLWPGGSTGLNLNGSSNNVKNKLAVWDGGRVRSSHVELAGRVVQRDNPAANSDHATHVAGTLIAAGVNPLAKGMSFGQQELVAYDFGNDNTEIFAEAANLLVSNHSYGSLAGWEFNNNRWEFWGLAGANEDYQFGYYDGKAQLWDSIAYNAPYYLIVKSAGNKRNENGPAVGQPYWRRNASGVFEQQPARPAGISSNDGYDIIQSYGVAKNILTIGAVNPIPTGYTKPQDVVISSFSSWGASDDGRIKPDVVADGVGLLSSVAQSDNAYASFSGTSMSSPNTAGSLLLLQEYYSQLHAGAFMRAATLKGLIIHTTDEAGPAPGPDYQHGWGLINMRKAAAVITANNTTQLIHENVLNNSASFSLPVVATGNGKISATISWTDPKTEQVIPVVDALNNTTPRLVNDLDIVIKRGATVYRSWILNPALPSADATTGDNTRDNVEKIELSEVVPGQTYTIEVTHKGTLARGQQAYSLIASGVGGQPYCASNPTSTAGARIDSVSFANIQNKNVLGCTSYSDFTNLTVNLQPGQLLPLFVRLNSCDATNVDKVVKAYIDANNDGDFTDAGENIATSAVINGNGDFLAPISVPAGLTPGKYSILRIVVQETSSAASVTPCNTYTRGETQDYRVLIVTPSSDFGVTGMVSPKQGDCGSGSQYVTIRIRNFGTDDKKNIPITAVIKQGATTVATLNALYTDTIYALTEEVYTFQTPFNALPGTAYTITSSTSLGDDQDASNNQNVTNVTINANSADPAGTAIACGPNALLNVTSPSTSDLYNWYTTATATNPVATGPSTSTTTISPTYYLARNEVAGKLGPANKMVFTDGGYNAFVNNMVRITTSVPATIENVKLYIGNSGKITFLLREIVSYNETTGAYQYFPVSSHTIDVTATAPTPPVHGAQNNDPADQGAIYHLGINIPTAGNYGIVIQCQNGASIFRNNNILTNPYPFTIPNIISITGNSAFEAGNPNFYQRFYYFFYDMTVKLTGCPSNRVPITAPAVTAPVISLSGNVLTSTAATSYQWYRNGNPISGAFSQSYTPTESGIYRVDATYAGGCTLPSNEINFTLTPVINIDPDEIGMIISPNPSPNGQFTLQLETVTRSNMTVAILNTAGQKVYQQTIPNFIGRLVKDIKPGKLAAGIYYVQVQHDKKMYVKKLVVTQ